MATTPRSVPLRINLPNPCFSRSTAWGTASCMNESSSNSLRAANTGSLGTVNGSFTITVIDANSFDLVGSTFSGAYLNTGWASVSRNLAPASNTDIRVQFVTIADYAELTTEITAGRGQSVAGQGLGVNVLSTIPPAVTPVGGQARGTSGALPVLAATGYSANPVAVTTARGVDLLATLIGALVIKPYAIPEADWQYAAAAGGIINTTDVVLRAAGAAGIRNYVTSIDLRNAHPTVATEVVTVAAVGAAAVTVVVGVETVAEIVGPANLVGMTVVPVNLAETTALLANLVVKTVVATGLPLPAKSPKAS